MALRHLQIQKLRQGQFLQFFGSVQLWFSLMGVY
jgi:hypothetical protein